MFDFPETPVRGTTVAAPDGSYRTWDGAKWVASPSAGTIVPPTNVLLVNAADDVVAAAAGVERGEYYRNGNVVMQRVT